MIDSVYAWLKVATAGLAEPGRGRIVLEIESHYAEAVAALTNEGKTKEAAKIEALDGLGSPTGAAKKFHRTCLTVKEAKQYRQFQSGTLEGRSWVVYVVWWFLLLAAVKAVFSWEFRHDVSRDVHGHAILTAICIVLAAIPVLQSFCISLRKHRPMNSGWVIFSPAVDLILISVLGSCDLGAALALIFFAVPPTVRRLLRAISIWRKHRFALPA